MLHKRAKRYAIHKKIRAKISGTKERPRLFVFKSASHVYAQLIDDEHNTVLVSANDIKMKKNVSKTQHSVEVGKLIAKAALEKKIDKVVFDRGGFLFHGRIKAVADGAREGGLKF